MNACISSKRQWQCPHTALLQKGEKPLSMPHPHILLAWGAQRYSGLRWRHKLVFLGVAGHQGYQHVAVWAGAANALEVRGADTWACTVS